MTDKYKPISFFIVEAFTNSKEHGFHDDEQTDGVMDPAKVLAKVPEKLCLIHSEVSEALECYREGKMESYIICDWAEIPFCDSSVVIMEDGKCQLHDKMHKPEGFLSELADIVIRVFDLVGALGKMDEFVNILDAKMKYNRSRPYMHGKRC